MLCILFIHWKSQQVIKIIIPVLIEFYILLGGVAILRLCFSFAVYDLLCVQGNNQLSLPKFMDRKEPTKTHDLSQGSKISSGVGNLICFTLSNAFTRLIYKGY